MHFTATLHIPPASTVLKTFSINGSSGVEPRDFTTDLNAPTYPLNLINPDNARTLRITAAAGTELAGAYSNGTCKAPHVGPFIPEQKEFTTRRAVILHAAWLVQGCPH